MRRALLALSARCSSPASTQRRKAARASILHKMEAITRNADCRNLQIAYEDISIAIMGAAGSGKSTFINLVSDSELPVSESLEPSTHVDVANYSDSPPGRSVKLIDTPGLDVKSSDDILKAIMATCPPAKPRRKAADGVVYLHRVSNAVPNITKHLLAFKTICGDITFRRVVIVTNMWSELPEEAAMGIPNDGGIGLKGDAKIFRHDNTRSSASRILNSLIEDHRPPALSDAISDIREAEKGCIPGCFGGIFSSRSP
ncbi:hypothetical protein BDZ94DRAFT_1308499 [Collybia nuda]|uniref:G domain-containing protein n=1 Tax=Collybia nuda TaxID=64659 RepID=A0A9P5Y9V4_9AGAR|nr:hypothetical protein BDZ94DRAFT_1308499 [Collybia nuda]